MSELNLLVECIATEGEAEDGGVKYIYMDENTIYRFENNRMKKISKSLINKAKKQITLQNQLPTNDNVSVEPTTTTTTKSKKMKKQPPIIQPPIDEDDNEYDDDEDIVEPPPVQKVKKSKRSKQSSVPVSVPYSPNINLDEYYNNKNKMEYMNLEITRLNNKVEKLKQYKAIVNKLTGSEFDMDTSNISNQRQSIVNETQQPTRNDSLFLY